MATRRDWHFEPGADLRQSTKRIEIKRGRVQGTVGLQAQDLMLHCLAKEIPDVYQIGI